MRCSPACCYKIIARTTTEAPSLFSCDSVDLDLVAVEALSFSFPPSLVPLHPEPTVATCMLPPVAEIPGIDVCFLRLYAPVSLRPHLRMRETFALTSSWPEPIQLRNLVTAFAAAIRSVSRYSLQGRNLKVLVVCSFCVARFWCSRRPAERQSAKEVSWVPGLSINQSIG